MKLFCLSHAGGSANVFLVWRRRLAPGVELVPVELPGRGRRIGAPLCDRFGDVLEDVVSEVTREGVGERYALFGHSFGAILAFELAHALVRRGDTPPRRLFVSASCSPDRVQTLDFAIDGDDRKLLGSLAHLGGTPDEIATDEEAVALFAPILRADLRALAAYRFSPQPKLPSDLSILLGTRDPIASADDAVRWSEVVSGRSTSVLLDGGHFAALEQVGPVTSTIDEALAESTSM